MWRMVPRNPWLRFQPNDAQLQHHTTQRSQTFVRSLTIAYEHTRRLFRITRVWRDGTQPRNRSSTPDMRKTRTSLSRLHRPHHSLRGAQARTLAALLVFLAKFFGRTQPAMAMSVATACSALSTASPCFRVAPRACTRPSRSVVRCGLSSPTTRTLLPAGRGAAASRRLSTAWSTRHVSARGLGSETAAADGELYVVRVGRVAGSTISRSADALAILTPVHSANSHLARTEARIPAG
jgi:hypothetical protein